MKKLKRNLDAVLIALFMAGLGLGAPLFVWAATQIGTNQIKNAAITHPKLHANVTDVYATDTELATGLATKEPTISAGEVSQYYRGDKSWSTLNLDALTDIIASGAAQGDILYFDTDLWKVLSAGASGKFLKTQGAAANPIWDTPPGGISGSGTANKMTMWTGATSIGDSTVVDSGGKIGIGVATPTHILSLNNTIAQTFWIENSAETTVGRALTVNAGSTIAGATVDIAGGNLILNSGLGKGTGASDMIFSTGKTLATGATLQTLTEVMRIKGSGNIGMGTNAPLRRLDINEASGNALRLIYNDSDGAAAYYADFLVSSVGSLRINPVKWFGIKTNPLSTFDLLLSDTLGGDTLTIRNSTSAVVAKIDSAGRIDTVGSITGKGIKIGGVTDGATPDTAYPNIQMSPGYLDIDTGDSGINYIRIGDTGTDSEFVRIGNDGTVNMKSIKHLRFLLIDPSTLTDTTLCLMPKTDAAITVTSIYVTCDKDPAVEITGNLKWADDFIGLANAAVIDAIDTDTGIRNDTSIAAPAVAADKCVYIQFSTQPGADIKSIAIDIRYTIYQ